MGWVVSTTPRPRFSPREKTPVPIVQETGWAPDSLDKEAIGKILCLCRGSNPDRPVVQPVVRHSTAWGNPAHKTGKDILIKNGTQKQNGAGVAQSVYSIRLQTWRPKLDPRQTQGIFPVASVSRPALNPTKPPIQWVSVVLFPMVKSGRGVMLTTTQI
jgi:hypothetical protein